MSQDVALLQRQLVTALLLAEPLPGGLETLDFPDREFLLRQDVVRVLDDNLAGTLRVEDVPKPVRVVTSDELRTQAARAEIAYLRFQPVQIEGDTVTLMLEARVAGPTDRTPLGLGTVQVRFAPVDDEWHVAEPPTVVAI